MFLNATERDDFYEARRSSNRSSRWSSKRDSRREDLTGTPVSDDSADEVN